MSDYYDKDGSPMDRDTWSKKWSDFDYRVVAKTDLGPVRVSTIWLGTDHGFGDGPPLIFETMVFDNEEQLTDPFNLDWIDDSTMPESLKESLRNSALAKGGRPYHPELSEYTNRHHTEEAARNYHEEVVATLTALFAVTEEALQQLTEQDKQ